MEKAFFLCNLSGVDCGSGGHNIARVLSSPENKISLMAQFQNKNKMKNKRICKELNMNQFEYLFWMAEFIFRSLSKFNAYQRLLRLSFSNFVNLPKLFSPKQFKIFQGHFPDKTYKRLQHQLKHMNRKSSDIITFLWHGLKVVERMFSPIICRNWIFYENYRNNVESTRYQ